MQAITESQTILCLARGFTLEQAANLVSLQADYNAQRDDEGVSYDPLDVINAGLHFDGSAGGDSLDLVLAENEQLIQLQQPQASAASLSQTPLTMAPVGSSNHSHPTSATETPSGQSTSPGASPYAYPSHRATTGPTATKLEDQLWGRDWRTQYLTQKQHNSRRYGSGYSYDGYSSGSSYSSQQSSTSSSYNPAWYPQAAQSFPMVRGVNHYPSYSSGSFATNSIAGQSRQSMGAQGMHWGREEISKMLSDKVCVGQFSFERRQVIAVVWAQGGSDYLCSNNLWDRIAKELSLPKWVDTATLPNYLARRFDTQSGRTEVILPHIYYQEIRPYERVYSAEKDAVGADAKAKATEGLKIEVNVAYDSAKGHGSPLASSPEEADVNSSSEEGSEGRASPEANSPSSSFDSGASATAQSESKSNYVPQIRSTGSIDTGVEESTEIESRMKRGREMERSRRNSDDPEITAEVVLGAVGEGSRKRKRNSGEKTAPAEKVVAVWENGKIVPLNAVNESAFLPTTYLGFPTEYLPQTHLASNPQAQKQEQARPTSSGSSPSSSIPTFDLAFTEFDVDLAFQIAQMSESELQAILDGTAFSPEYTEPSGL